MHVIRGASIVSLSLFLGACGPGGSGDSGRPDTSSSDMGVLVDGTVTDVAMPTDTVSTDVIVPADSAPTDVVATTDVVAADAVVADAVVTDAAAGDASSDPRVRCGVVGTIVLACDPSGTSQSCDEYYAPSHPGTTCTGTGMSVAQCPATHRNGDILIGICIDTRGVGALYKYAAASIASGAADAAATTCAGVTQRWCRVVP